MANTEITEEKAVSVEEPSTHEETTERFVLKDVNFVRSPQTTCKVRGVLTRQL